MPRRISKDREAAFIAAFGGGMSITEACKVARISRPTGYKIVKDLKLRQVREDSVAKATDRIDEAAKQLVRDSASDSVRDMKELFLEARKRRSEFYEGLATKAANRLKEALETREAGSLRVAAEIGMRDMMSIKQEEMMLMSLGRDSRMHITWVDRDEVTGERIDARTALPLQKGGAGRSFCRCGRSRLRIR